MVFTNVCYSWFSILKTAHWHYLTWVIVNVNIIVHPWPRLPFLVIVMIQLTLRKIIVFSLSLCLQRWITYCKHTTVFLILCIDVLLFLLCIVSHYRLKLSIDYNNDTSYHLTVDYWSLSRIFGGNSECISETWHFFVFFLFKKERLTNKMEYEEWTQVAYFVI